MCWWNVKPYSINQSSWAVYASLYVYTRDHMLEVCQHDILPTDYGNFAKFTTFSAVGDKYELIKCLGERSQQDCVWSNKHFVKHFLAYIQNVWNLF